MNKKEYFFLSTGYAGGASRFIYDHINFLIKKNKKITLIDDNPYKTFSKIPKKIIIKKIKINSFQNKSNRKLENLFLKTQSEKIIFLTNYAFLIKYFSLINRFKNKNIKIILTIHSGLLNLTFKKYLAGFVFSLIYKKVDILCFGSNSAKNWWLKFYPWMRIKKNSVNFNGVELQKKLKYQKIKKQMHISFAGRLEKENNPNFFIKIANDYLKKEDNVVFNVYGDGTMLSYLKKISINKNIKFHGWIEKNKIYKNSDIIIITSKINNFPYVALEAKSFGIPVISCSQGDIKRIIKNKFDGYICVTNSTKTIINLIDKVKKNHFEFFKNSIERSKLFEINIACKKFWKNII